MADIRLAPHDLVVAHAVTLLAVGGVTDPARERLWLDLLHDALPFADRTLPGIPALCEAAGLLLSANTPTDWCRARWVASGAAERFAEWRLGAAAERLTRRKTA